MPLPAMANPLPIIRPITDLRTHLNDVCQQASESGSPVILTKNGAPAYVITDAATYDAQQRRNRAYLALREAEIEERYCPGSLSQKDADAELQEIFSRWGLDYAGN